MCPTKWQTQYNLTENTNFISTIALVLILENIENNANLEYKSQNPNKSKGIERKCKMESNNSWILKKPQEFGLD